MRSTFLAAVLLAITTSTGADSLVIIGTGSPGAWTTQLELANPGDATLGVTIYPVAGFQVCSTPACPFATLGIPAKGSITFATNALPFDSATQLQTLYVTPENDAALPVVRAYAINQANTAQKNILPVIRLSALTTLAPTTLTFPGASRTSTTHSNIAIGAVTTDGTNAPFSIQVEAFAPDGTLLGTTTVASTQVTDLGFVANIFLGDVLGQLGITDLTAGQVRITKLSGDGALWGAMATVTADCGVLIAEGINH